MLTRMRRVKGRLEQRKAHVGVDAKVMSGSPRISAGVFLRIYRTFVHFYPPLGRVSLVHSAKTRVGIKQVFEEVVQKILDNPALLANTAPGRPRGTIDPARSSNAQGGGGSCCF